MLLKKEHLGFWNLIKVPGVAFAYIISALGIFNFVFYSEILPLKLSEFGIDNQTIGYVYLFVNIPYVLMCLLHQFLFSNVAPKIQFVIGLSMCAVGLALMSADSQIFRLPNNQWTIFAGLIIIGASNIFTFIPSTPEIINQVTLKYKIKEGVDDELVGRMNDSISALYQIFYNTGGMLSPVLGAVLYSSFGYGTTMAAASFFILAAAIVYFSANARGCSKSLRDFKEEKKVLKELQGA